VGRYEFLITQEPEIQLLAQFTPPRAEARLLSAAAVLEDIVDLGVRTPIDPGARGRRTS